MFQPWGVYVRIIHRTEKLENGRLRDITVAQYVRTTDITRINKHVRIKFGLATEENLDMLDSHTFANVYVDTDIIHEVRIK